jgi:hypothetical protein
MAADLQATKEKLRLRNKINLTEYQLRNRNQLHQADNQIKFVSAEPRRTDSDEKIRVQTK